MLLLFPLIGWLAGQLLPCGAARPLPPTGGAVGATAGGRGVFIGSAVAGGMGVAVGTVVAGGTGVAVAAVVAVGTGRAVGTVVAVGTAVAVGTGVAVADTVAVAGIAVAVMVGVGVTVGDGAGVAVAAEGGALVGTVVTTGAAPPHATRQSNTPSDHQRLIVSPYPRIPVA